MDKKKKAKSKTSLRVLKNCQPKRTSWLCVYAFQLQNEKQTLTNLLIIIERRSLEDNGTMSLCNELNIFYKQDWKDFHS